MAAWYVQFIDGGALALASLFVLLGAGVLFFAWRRRERHAGLLLLAWGLVAVSFHSGRAQPESTAVQLPALC